MNGFLLESAARDVFGQMALDEAVALSRPEAFGLRFYRWAGIGATFGYAQRVREVERVLPSEIGANFTRRPTGGGVVPHVGDVTFSCVFPAGGELRPGNIYRRLHAAILPELRGAGLAARLNEAGGSAAPGGPDGASQCFVQSVALDILTDAGKVLGGAIRRYGDTVLYQGSLQGPDARAKADVYEKAIRQGLAAEWGLEWEECEVAAGVAAAAQELEGKYRSAEWVRRR
ncbi:MAG: lipoate--protein ligase family protein [Lentisphaerae bacterium]|nr:lipoate--protein ligase family protein [Lentisphaerota bacterium]